MNIPINKIQKKDNYICQYCGKDGLANLDNWHDCGVDHFIPRNYGGSDEPDNLITCCHYCNQIKGKHLFNSLDEAKQFVSDRRKELQKIFEEVKRIIRNK